MVERVARAIDRAMTEQMDPTPGYLARAAIAAMREPTEGMVTTGASCFPFGIRRVWEAMIAHALGLKK